MTAIVPIPRCPVSIRVATMADLPFIDRLQSIHTKQVGWMPTKQIEGKIAAGQVIVAEDAGEAVGYCIGHDQYFKRDDVGIIYQLNVVPGRQRKLVGAMLIKAMFERAAYGCRLFCCWCAQDIEANYFWESLGFFPLAFRSGSRTKGRTHIFWQRRIHEGDTTTPFWYPSQTTGGAIREDRLVLPIPPDVNWKDVMPRVLPGEGAAPRLPAPSGGQRRKGEAPAAVAKPGRVRLQALSFAQVVEPIVEKPKPQKRAKVKNDPTHVAAARELRDRYLERFNSGVLTGEAKYSVGRLTAETRVAGLLEAA